MKKACKGVSTSNVEEKNQNHEKRIWVMAVSVCSFSL